jgi:BMFP domain-containing protein YqiC
MSFLGITDMIDVRSIDELAKRLSELVPPGAREARAELADAFRDTLRAGLRKLDLVTREEFDVQRSVLLRTREKVDELEQRVAQLEDALGAPRH